ncbi:MAG: DUF2752 domain-containing protein [Sphingobacteriaceae bacterium]|nr:DUF2752 domain-containing protein [Sphingobacteriaceae bacterium]
MFGIDCPGCGMTRAFFALIRGNLMESLSYNPGLIPFLITVTALLIQLKLKHPRGGFLSCGCSSSLPLLPSSISQ